MVKRVKNRHEAKASWGWPSARNCASKCTIARVTWAKDPDNQEGQCNTTARNDVRTNLPVRQREVHKIKPIEWRMD